MRTRGTVVGCLLLLTAKSLFLGNCFAFQTTVPYSPVGVSATSSSHEVLLLSTSRYETSLHMGLRSFIKRKVLRRRDESDAHEEEEEDQGKYDDDEDEEMPLDDEEPHESPQERAYIPEALSDDVEQSTSPPDDNKDLPPFYHEETVQERINRVKSGKMTIEEKEAFVRSALSAKDTSTSRKPLRQPLPRVDGSKSASSKKFTASASPFPKDSLLRSFARGKREGEDETEQLLKSARKWRDGETLESQKKKREYFDMVTDPNRFHTYKSSSVDLGGPAGGVRPLLDDEVPQNQDEENINEDLEDMPDLGKRLEAAAHAMEEAAQAKGEVERRKREEAKREQRRIMEEANKRRAAEMARQQLEEKARLREKEEAKAREENEKHREEQARLLELQRAQDDFWKKKLQRERDSSMRDMTLEQKKKVLRREAELEEEAKNRVEDEMAAQKTNKTAATESKGPSAPKVQRTPDDILRKTPVKKEESEATRAFKEEQARRRKEIERQREEQIARLKSLNSPIPAHPHIGMTPSPPSTPVRVPTPKPAPAVGKTPPASVTNDAGRGVPSLREMTRLNVPKGAQNRAPAQGASQDSGPSISSMWAGARKADETVPKKEAPKKRVVRQALPLGDEEDFVEGPGKGLSIKEAMKKAGADISQGDQEERSKKWGVDMSRISRSLEEEQKRDGK